MEIKKIYDFKESAQLVDKLSETIIEHMFKDPSTAQHVGIIGIQAKGVPLAQMIAAAIQEKCNITVPVGTLDITMYRDDLGGKKLLPQIYETDIPFDIEDKIILLVDEISHTGRTVRAALDAITYFGRPRIIRFATLFDRGAHEIPIRPDFVAEHLTLPANEWLSMETDEANQTIVKICER